MKDGKKRIEALMQGKRVFRVHNFMTGAWWEGTAGSPKKALLKAAREMTDGSTAALEIRELTIHGGWKKCKEPRDTGNMR